MSINNLPSAVQQIVQDGWLLRFFDAALFPNLLYRDLYEGMEVPQHLGQTYTFTKTGLLPLVNSALAPVTNTDLTSGLTPAQVSYEQYSAELSQYAAAVMTNMLSSGIAIVDLYKKAVEDLGRNAGQSLDVLARRNMSQAYQGGRTYVTAAVTGTSVAVADISGFDFIYVNGVRQATSVTNPLAITITQSGVAASRNVTGTTAGSITAADYAADFIPGTLTLSASTAVIAGDTAVASTAPFSVRAGGDTTIYTMGSSDILTLAHINAAVSKLRSMAVPTHADGYYHAILNPNQAQQLMNDAAVQRIYDTHDDSTEFMHGVLGIGAGCKIYHSAQTPQHTSNDGTTIYSGLITGADAGYEVRSSLISNWLNVSNLSATGYVMFSPQHYVAMVLRTPLDTLQQVVTNSWSFIGAWLPATDVLSTVGMGSSTSNYKRAVSVFSA